MFKRIFDIDEWKVIERRLHKDDMRLSESIMSAGNGYMGLRGNFEEKYSGDTHRGTYIAGVWFPDKTRVGWWKIGYPEYFGKVINSTNFIGIGLKVNNHEVDLAVDEVLDFYRELDMKTGVLSRRAVVNTPVGIVEIDTERFLSLKQQEAAAIKYMVRCPDNDAIIELAPYLDGAVYNEDSNYKESFWQEAYRRSDDCKGTVIMKTKDNPFGAPTFSACTSMKITHYGKVQDISSVDRESFVETKITFNANAGEWVGIDKIVALTSTRQISADALAEKAEEIAENMARLGYVEAKYQNALCWRDRWNKADVVIEGDVEAQQGIRYNIFQLFSTYYGEDATLNIGPKGFTGEKYGGATYWDTEAFLLPFYLALASEEVSRNLLIYRHNQLEGAYTNARKQGLEGALYPMVTFTGVECHNEWEITFEEIHRNGAIAHAIFEYINYTGDKSYLHNYGIDVLVGISRFWASRVHYSSSKKMYMIHGVTGPNEYENNVNNNWYTNRIAAWCLEYTLEAIDNLRVNGYSSKLDELGIKVLELDRWKDIAENMYLPYDATSGVFVQHDTFLDKDLIPASDIPADERPINQHWSWDKILRSCFLKQADVLQGLYFLGHLYDTDVKRRNFLFYEPMTVHESSLSPCIHSIMASELGMKDKAVEMYKRTARLDLDNYNNDTEDGLHISSMSGSWLAIVQGFAGMRTAMGILSFKPFLPDGWSSYSFKINYRGRRLNVFVNKENAIVTLETGEPLEVIVSDIKYILKNEIKVLLPERQKEVINA